MREILQRFRALGEGGSDAERALWARVRGGRLGARFRRRAPVGGYVADFACLERRLIVELDGERAGCGEAERARDDSFAAHGFHVLRFREADVLLRPGAVIADLWHTLESSAPRAAGSPSLGA